MKQVNTGAGLVFLGACILGAVAFASPKPMPVAGMTGDGGSSPVRMPTTTACEDLEPQIWFTTVHPIAACPDGSMRYPVGFGGSAIDLDRDGVAEGLVLASSIDLSGSNSPMLWSQEVSISGGVTTFVHRPVLMSESLRQRVLANVPDASSAYCYPPTWRDMDRDGDIDLVLFFYASAAPGGLGFSETVWIENTGLPAAPPPNPYDLDQDGNVNTADLSLLLLEFTD